MPGHPDFLGYPLSLELANGPALWFDEVVTLSRWLMVVRIMREDERQRIEEIIGGMSCPKGFKCAESGFVNLCKAKDFGVESFLDCLDEGRSHCKFALPFADIHLCQCPLRVYVAKKLKK